MPDNQQKPQAGLLTSARPLTLPGKAPANAIEAAGWLDAAFEANKIGLADIAAQQADVGLGLEERKVSTYEANAAVDRSVAMADLGIRQEDLKMRQEEFGWKRQDRKMQDTINKGMLEAAQSGGYTGVIDFLRGADPEKAIDFHTKKIQLDNSILQNDTLQTIAADGKQKALFDSYALGGKIMAGVMSAPEDQQSDMYKSVLPMLQKINPDAPTKWGQDAQNMAQLMMSQATPENQLFALQNGVFKAQSATGKLLADYNEALKVYGADSQESQILAGKLGQTRLSGQIKALQYANTIDQQKRSGEDNLRKEWEMQNKEFVGAKNSYLKIRDLAKDPGGDFKRGVNDMSLIFAYMKLLDPTSVVRESEFATAENTTGVPEDVRRQYNKTLTGEKLNMAQRESFVNGADILYKSYLQSHEQLRGEYLKIVDERGYSAQSALPNLAAPQQNAQQPKILRFNPTTGRLE